MTTKTSKKMATYREMKSLNANFKHRYMVESGHRARVKSAVFGYYGGNPPKCACCGESKNEFLTIDHSNNDGAKHRKLNRSVRGGLYWWLFKNNFPKGFQVLCMNCNWGKRLGGVCPHKNSNQ